MKKLLWLPSLLFSWYTNARSRSSNTPHHSSHEMCSSLLPPLSGPPAKSKRRTRGRPSSPRVAAAGSPPRRRAQSSTTSRERVASVAPSWSPVPPGSSIHCARLVESDRLSPCFLSHCSLSVCCVLVAMTASFLLTRPSNDKGGCWRVSP